MLTPHEEGESTSEPPVVERKKKTTLCISSREFITLKLSNYLQFAKQCVLATRFPSERVFSTSGNIVPCLRAFLKPDTVDRLVLLFHNLQERLESMREAQCTFLLYRLLLKKIHLFYLFKDTVILKVQNCV